MPMGPLVREGGEIDNQVPPRHRPSMESLSSEWGNQTTSAFLGAIHRESMGPAPDRLACQRVPGTPMHGGRYVATEWVLDSWVTRPLAPGSVDILRTGC
jgi:hypothetical protein